MKIVFTLFAIVLQLTAFAQQMTAVQWEEESRTNIRLLPKYGHIEKSEGQKESDRDFIESALKRDTTYRKASDHLVRLGFSYLYRNDIRTAMYRFNQAFLLDSTNTDIYWGYGGVYTTLGAYDEAEKQYLEGLAIDPASTHLLTDYGTLFMARFYQLQAEDNKSASGNIDKAVEYLRKSYALDPEDQNTLFKLSICYLIKADCDQAWKFYNACMALGGRPVTKDFTRDLRAACKQD